MGPEYNVQKCGAAVGTNINVVLKKQQQKSEFQPEILSFWQIDWSSSGS